MALTLDKIDQSLIDKQTGNIVQGKDIVIIGLQPWYYDIGSNCKNIATHLAEHNRVLYVNQPINRKTYLSRHKNKGISKHCSVIKYGGGKIRNIQKNMWEHYPTCIVESINKVPSTNIFSMLNYFNNHKFAVDLKAAIDFLQFKDIILFNDNDIYNGYYLKQLLSPSLYIYYCRDFLQGYNYWKKHCSILEPKLIKKADVVVTNSNYYASYCKLYNSNSHYIGQGYNTELFHNRENRSIPNAIKDLSYPIIGYVGALDSARLDKKIIEYIATENPKWNIVLVGPEDDSFKKSPLHKLPNVHFIGKQPLESLPDYINAFNVCINPQLLNKITVGNYPLKIDEYLAMGQPVVATKTSEMERFAPYTYLAEKPEEYSALIKKALLEDNETRRIERMNFAECHTWDKSISQLYKIISNYFLLNKN